MIDLFLYGGVHWMTILTLELVALLLAAFKAPRWVSYIGSIALSTGLLGTLIGLFNALTAIQKAGDISPALLAGGCRCAIIGITYGLIIYITSRIVKIILLPRM